MRRWYILISSPSHWWHAWLLAATQCCDRSFFIWTGSNREGTIPYCNILWCGMVQYGDHTATYHTAPYRTTPYHSIHHTIPHYTIPYVNEKEQRRNHTIYCTTLPLFQTILEQERLNHATLDLGAVHAVQSGVRSILSCTHLALFDISISNIDCRYIDSFEKYRYRYGHFWKYRYR